MRNKLVHIRNENGVTDLEDPIRMDNARIGTMYGNSRMRTKIKIQNVHAWVNKILSQAGDNDLVIWTDGASNNNPGAADSGVFITSKNLTCKYELYEGIGRYTNNGAELWAINIGLKWIDEVLNLPKPPILYNLNDNQWEKAKTVVNGRYPTK